MDGDPTPALTGRRRTRPTSIGCRNPWQPKPGRAPLIAAHAAVQTNRATSVARDQGAGPLLVPLFELLCPNCIRLTSRPSDDPARFSMLATLTAVLSLALALTS